MYFFAAAVHTRNWEIQISCLLFRTGGWSASFGGVVRWLRMILCGIDAHHRATQIAKRHGVERLF